MGRTEVHVGGEGRGMAEMGWESDGSTRRGEGGGRGGTCVWGKTIEGKGT